MFPRGELPCTQRGEVFFENRVFAITLVAQTDPQMFQSVKTFPSQSVTGNGNAKMHSFLSQRFFGGSHFSSFGKSVESICQKIVHVAQNRQFFEPHQNRKIAKPNFLDGAFFPLFFLAVQIFLQSTCGNRRWISASGKRYKSNLITFSAPRGCGKAPPGSPFLHRSVPQLFRPYGNSQWTCTFFRNFCTSTRPDSKRLKHAPPFPPFNDKRKKASETECKIGKIDD